ncbi:hypothetical protein J437_LFUL002392 [Ladona fulva]|uniref:Peptidase M13 N-terminal domain-containing protein n=1 Tax=Ladona fulva TaxID=123851 RepID=A0A8K0K7T7_LADFU|nr:hypothetical protein J437_LFUL002392 [Ladona fulva]
MLLEEEVAEDALVQVYFESYFKALFEELGHSGERRTVNALMVMFTHELYYGLVTNRQYCNRRNYCLKVSQKLMDDVSSALFLKSFGSEKLQKFQTLVNQIYNELILSFKSDISKMTWMDAESQTAALEKAQHMRLFADGGMSVFLNDTHLDSQLHEYPMNSGYLENAILLLKRYRKRMYSTYKKDPSDSEQM